jgi:hypothetical protein
MKMVIKIIANSDYNPYLSINKKKLQCNYLRMNIKKLIVVMAVAILLLGIVTTYFKNGETIEADILIMAFCHVVAKEDGREKDARELNENIKSGLKAVPLTDEEIKIGVRHMIKSMRDDNFTPAEVREMCDYARENKLGTI